MSIKKLRDLNDAMRTSMSGGRVMLTNGVSALPDAKRTQLLRAVASFTDFNEDNDPWNEHDFGAIELDGTKFFWKIDYYDKHLEYGSPDAADPMVTTRVMTIMRADEY